MNKKKTAAKRHHEIRKSKGRRKRSTRPATGNTNKVIVVFNTQKSLWMAFPGVTVLSSGDAIQWHALNAKKFTFAPDPNVFENIKQMPGNKVSATVLNGISGYFVTDMTVDDDSGTHPVEGGSSPAVIID